MKTLDELVRRRLEWEAGVIFPENSPDEEETVRERRERFVSRRLEEIAAFLTSTISI